MERIKTNDVKRKNNGTEIFFANTFIESNEMIYNNFTRISTLVNQLFLRAYTSEKVWCKNPISPRLH
ncbi:MAG: hypothetical protein JETT_1599 [Candidatus Jettenia ecosi]|uniref:Uncharacterized protein n=1 Tax=Candidatus Jettenia ecosi TaxID=2494326 RepID=A0A533QCF1_9BACT|nr:MAG: hypothetical protein JETT_1599 [Candidatus Jettenia ecosi]